MKIRYKLAFAGLVLAASAVGFVAAWSWFLREYRLQGDPFALLMVVGLPAGVVVGLFYARQRVRQLDAWRQQEMGRSRRDE
jgi:hypothetical protein